jgi:hypothetical protein
VEIASSAFGGGVPTGEVTFELVSKARKKAKVRTLGTATVSDGNARLAVVAKMVPNKAIKIVYSGDANDAASDLTVSKWT